MLAFTAGFGPVATTVAGDPALLASVNAAREEALAAAVTGIPTFLVGRARVVGCERHEVLAGAAERAGAAGKPLRGRAGYPAGMRLLPFVALVVSLLAALVSCGEDPGGEAGAGGAVGGIGGGGGGGGVSPPPAPAVGDPCSTDEDCPGGSCVTSVPGGMCIRECATSVACGPEAFCGGLVDGKPGICVGLCSTDEDCREGWACHDAWGTPRCTPLATGTGELGDPCETSADCSGGRDGYCRPAPHSPGGSCGRFCDDARPCPGGSSCVWPIEGVGSCLEECATDEDCGREGYQCFDPVGDSVNRCWISATGEGATGDPCESTADCRGGPDGFCKLEEGGLFLGGSCSRRCSTHEQCGPGNVCLTGGCARQCWQASDCREGQECFQVPGDNFSRCVPAGVGSGETGAPCEAIWECAGGAWAVCLQAVETLGGYCSRYCATDADCPEEARCSGAQPGGWGYCLRRCATAADCRAGYGCTNADLDPEGTTECYGFGDGTGAPGAPCYSVHDCAGGARALCAKEAWGFYRGGYCALVGCDDCPEGAVCVPGDPGEGDFCMAGCAADADCREGYLCLEETPGERGCQPAGTGTGGLTDPCEGLWDCSGGSAALCWWQRSGGHCSRFCGVDFPACPEGSECLPEGDFRLCMLGCASDEDCAPEFLCGARRPGAASPVCEVR